MGKGSRWMEQAACVGHAHLFAVEDQIQSDSRKVGSRWASYDKGKFEKAIKICRNCPVLQKCGETATQDDFDWTVRAGLMPAIFTNTQPKPHPGKPAATPARAGVCKKGHVDQFAGEGRRRYCKPCANEARKKKRRLKGVQPVTLQLACKNGHVGMYSRKPSGTRYCRGCRQESNARRIRRKSPAIMPS